MYLVKLAPYLYVSSDSAEFQQVYILYIYIYIYRSFSEVIIQLSKALGGPSDPITPITAYICKYIYIDDVNYALKKIVMQN